MRNFRKNKEGISTRHKPSVSIKDATAGITLVALVVTIVVLLILAGISLSLILGNYGVITKANEGRTNWANASAEEQKMLNDLSDQIDGYTGSIKNDGKLGVFDTGANVLAKIGKAILGHDATSQSEAALAGMKFNGIKKYNGTPSEEILSGAVDVSWTQGYSLYQANPEAFSDIIPEGTELCPIYIWFEETGETEIRNILGDVNLTSTEQGVGAQEVNPGFIYWWSEASNVYLNQDSSRMFQGAMYLSDISGLQTLKTDFVTDMSSMFVGGLKNNSLINVDALVGWNTENVTNMSNMFHNQSGLTDIKGLNNWDVSAVQNMSGMFGATDALRTELVDLSGLSHWDVSSVTDMSEMFYNSGVTDLLPIAGWNVENVQYMGNMFAYCSELTDASGINNWNITNVTNFSDMFRDCQVHPEFTKVTGSWDDDGTFTPDD